MSNNYRDLALADFADDERELLERLASVEDDRDVYREMVQLTLQHLYKLATTHRQLRDQHTRLLEDYRRLRASLDTRTEAA